MSGVNSTKQREQLLREISRLLMQSYSLMYSLVQITAERSKQSNVIDKNVIDKTDFDSLMVLLSNITDLIRNNSDIDCQNCSKEKLTHLLTELKLIVSEIDKQEVIGRRNPHSLRDSTAYHNTNETWKNMKCLVSKAQSPLTQITHVLLTVARTLTRVIDCIVSVLINQKTFNERGETPLARSIFGRSQFFPRPISTVNDALFEMKKLSKLLDEEIAAMVNSSPAPSA